MRVLGGKFEDEFSWPETDIAAIDESLCYHANKQANSIERLDLEYLKPVSYVVDQMELHYQTTKVVYTGWPQDFGKFIRENVDWNASPGYPWKKNYPTNRDLFGFDGVQCDPLRVAMVEMAVRTRWNELLEQPKADPIHCFVKPEPHKKSKVQKRSWRLISGVGLTDTLVDRILYGNWLDKMVKKWNEIPSKAGWTPSRGGYKWLVRTFGPRTPMSIDKSAWDWTVNYWHVSILEHFLPRMIVGRDVEWNDVFRNRIQALFMAGYPVFKFQCGCEFTQLVTGIMKSGCLGTIGFNSLWQYASHVAIGGNPDSVFHALGDDTSQEEVSQVELYIQNLAKTGAEVKEVDIGYPLKFGGHEISFQGCKPAYRQKHLFSLLYAEEKVLRETLESYQYLYALDYQMLLFIQTMMVQIFGPESILSEEYLKNWYNALE